jgi:carbamoyl-phosphate synthase large subunit
VHDTELEEAAARIARAVGIRGVANIQFKRDSQRTPKLLEINPRFPGTVPLTIAAGVDIPSMVIDDLLGQLKSTERMVFRELAMVRIWREIFVQTHEVDALTNLNAQRSEPALNEAQIP